MGTWGIAALVCGAIVVALLAAAFVNTLVTRPKGTKGGQPTASTMPETEGYTPEEEQRYAEILAKLVRVPTVSYVAGRSLDEFFNFHKVLRECFPLIHQRLELTVIEGNLLYRWAGRDPKAEGLLLMGHQDVVPAEETGWHCPPFEGVIHDSQVWGRGAMDCKCTVMAEMMAVEELLSNGYTPERDVYLAYAVDEEARGIGAKYIANELDRRGVRLCAVVDEGGAIVENALPGCDCQTAMVGVMEKGYLDAKFIARGNGGHSSTPPRNNPMARLGKLIAYMERKRPFRLYMNKSVVTMFSELAPHLGFGMRFLMGNLWLFKPLATRLVPAFSSYGAAFMSTTFVFTMCSGSAAENVIPDAAYAVCNLRTIPHQSNAECINILERLAKRFDLELEILDNDEPSNITAADGREFKLLKQSVEACYPAVPAVPYVVMGGTDSRNYQGICDNCLRLAAVRMTPAQLAAMHAANESIGILALAESVKFYKHYIRNHA